MRRLSLARRSGSGPAPRNSPRPPQRLETADWVHQAERHARTPASPAPLATSAQSVEGLRPSQRMCWASAYYEWSLAIRTAGRIHVLPWGDSTKGVDGRYPGLCENHWPVLASNVVPVAVVARRFVFPSPSCGASWRRRAAWCRRWRPMRPQAARPRGRTARIPCARCDADSIVATDIGDGLEVRRQPGHQPQHLDIGAAFQLQPARGTRPIQRAVIMQPQDAAWVIANDR